jgi:hypothetical protein
MSTPAASWEEIRQLLRQARDDLTSEDKPQQASPVPVGLLTGTLDEFEEFLGHNEFELAWEALASVAERLGAPPACWRKLARAASLMQLPDKELAARQHAAPLVPCSQALAIAQADAERVYRDLSGYRITIVLRDDGWHIDYDLTKPGVAGGGPHYVIDAQTGAILSKRYEQ